MPVFAAALLLCLAAPTLAQSLPAAAESQPARHADLPEELKMTPAEAAALEAVRDNDTQLDETAFYMLLAKAADLANQNFGVPRRQPSVESLTGSPQQWRGHPVWMRLRVYGVRKLAGEGELSASPYWSAGRAAWEVRGLAADRDGKPVPFVIFTPIEPAGLGAAQEGDSPAEKVYPGGTPVEVDGFFYKIWRHKNQGGADGCFPVIVAWRLAAAGAAPVADQGKSRTMMFVLLLGIFALYVFVRIRARRHRTSDEDGLAPYRRAWDAPDPRPAGDHPAGEATVDPRLADAAKQYRTEKEGDDAQDASR